MAGARSGGGGDAAGLRFGLVAARFNERVVGGLLTGALAALERQGAARDDVTVVHCPGAFEIPLAAKALAETGRVDAVICLGAVIRGGTPHFEHICDAVTRGTQRVALDTGVPVAFGVLTCENAQQAEMRSAPGEGNKGAEAAIAAVEMVELLAAIRGEG